jgi:predicted phosphodiesterase
MRIAVLSDIHANLHALEAVLADIDRQAVDEIWCLGDVVGYGPRPNECIELTRERAALALCGNHDLAATGGLDIVDFSGDAGTAVRWTESVLSPDNADWLRSLEPSAARADAELFHGSPRDPVWDYVLSHEVARESLEATTAPLVIVGHSHVALALSLDGDDLEGGPAPAATEVRTDGRRWLLNPGSVGQPRDGDPRAAYLLIEDGPRRGTFRRVPYPIEKTQAEIRSHGLPLTLAARLAHGV